MGKLISHSFPKMNAHSTLKCEKTLEFKKLKQGLLYVFLEPGITPLKIAYQ